VTVSCTAAVAAESAVASDGVKVAVSVWFPALSNVPAAGI
jgi:hypothetical protein